MEKRINISTSDYILLCLFFTFAYYLTGHGVCIKVAGLALFFFTLISLNCVNKMVHQQKPSTKAEVQKINTLFSILAIMQAAYAVIAPDTLVSVLAWAGFLFCLVFVVYAHKAIKIV